MTRLESKSQELNSKRRKVDLPFGIASIEKWGHLSTLAVLHIGENNRQKLHK